MGVALLPHRTWQSRPPSSARSVPLDGDYHDGPAHRDRLGLGHWGCGVAFSFLLVLLSLEHLIRGIERATELLWS
jgi:hypothetical protein